MGDDIKNCKKVSVYDIREDFVCYTKGFNQPDDYRDRVLKLIDKGINTLGWCAEDIYEIMNRAEKEDLSIEYMNNIFATKKAPRLNLLAGIDRTHSVTQLGGGNPIINFNEDIFLDIFDEEIEFESYLEARASFSIEDLVDYMTYNKKYMVIEVNDTNSIKGALSYVLEKVKDVNIVLFMIDECMEEYKRRNKKILNVFRIQDYCEEAINKHNNKKDRMATGDIKFIQKNRRAYLD